MHFLLRASNLLKQEDYPGSLFPRIQSSPSPEPSRPPRTSSLHHRGLPIGSAPFAPREHAGHLALPASAPSLCLDERLVPDPPQRELPPSTSSPARPHPELRDPPP